jgi:1-deoxy-D-xylulose-5-phosphate synthase
MGVDMPDRGMPLEIGRGRVLRQGTDIALLSFGAHLAEVLAAADALEAEGLSVTVADARFAKPLDTALIDRLVDGHRALITVEQGSTGGFGALVLHHLAAAGLLEKGRAIRTLTLPDRFIDQGSPAQMYAWAGLTAADIAATARAAFGPPKAGKVVHLA